MCLLNFIYTCNVCLTAKIMHHLQRNWPCFSLPKFCRSNIHITIVKFSNRPFQNPFNFLQRTSMDFCKVYQFLFLVSTLICLANLIALNDNITNYHLLMFSFSRSFSCYPKIFLR